MDEGTGREATGADGARAGETASGRLARACALATNMMPVYEAAIGAWLLWPLVCVGGLWLGHALAATTPEPFVVTMIALGWGLPLVAGVLWLSRFLREGRRLAGRVALSGGQATLAELVDALVFRPTRGNPTTDAALARLLSGLQPGEGAFLDRRQLQLLCGVLAYDVIADGRLAVPLPLSLGIIHALAAIGDLKALPQIERLAKRAKQPEVRAAPTDAAAELRALQASGTLLRPADGAAEELLRPASGAAEPVALQRPTTTPGDPHHGA